ncbi:MAG: hypothetical protein UY04_C0012G0004 [Parcubacteria group bacterium GW2011_GWA2_47_7]|nr:MAG: hypothetical protein UY04_C0012G0004 [Parcubacteria group bacterium GW2011_GWA2_47_7]
MTPTFITSILLGIAIIVLVVWLILLELRIKKLLAGKDARSLEDTISKNQSQLGELFAFKTAVETEMSAMDARLKKKIHGIRMLRFNPFAGTGSGGNQSFATAFLDEEGNGAVLSSLYSREKVSIFAKPVINRTSEFELSEEEKEVLK